MPRKPEAYQVLSMRQGKPRASPVERHHIAGRNNYSFTITIDANLHRRLSHLQYKWPPWLLRNPSRSELIALAGLLLGLLDLFALLLVDE